MRLKGKRALITGAAMGIGEGCAKVFAREGAEVFGVDLAAGEHVHFRADLTKFEAAEAAAAACTEKLGGIDCLVTAAAVGEFRWIEAMSPADFTRTMVGEIDTVFLIVKACWPYLKKQGGAIVTLASANAHVALRGSPAVAHTAGKGGVLAMTRQFAMEGAPHKIRANSISPGLIVTPATKPVIENPAFLAEVKNKLMLERLGQPEDIGHGAAYLCSDDASFVTGADLSIDGGATAW